MRLQMVSALLLSLASGGVGAAETCLSGAAPLTTSIDGTTVTVCQQETTIGPVEKDQLRRLSKTSTKLTAWKGRVGEGAVLWTKEIPSPAGSLFDGHAPFPALLKMDKPVQGAFPSHRYYNMASGTFVMASSVPVDASIKGRLVGLEVWASFLQPREKDALIPGTADPLVNRIIYAAAEGPLAILGLRCHGPVDKLAFDPLRPKLLVASDAIEVRYFSKFWGEQEKQIAVMRIPVRGDRPVIDQAAVPTGCRLTELEPSQNGEDIRYDDASDRALTAKAATTKVLRIDNLQNTELLTKLSTFSNLEELNIACLEEMRRLPDFKMLRHLRVLVIDNGNGCSMNPEIPDSIGELGELTKLVLFGAQDPKQFKIRRDLPKSLAKLARLETLNIGRNSYKKVPEAVFSIPNLRELDLSFNGLEDLPDRLGKMPKLARVILDSNSAISCSPTKQAELRKRFPKLEMSFENEYDCP